MLAKRIIPCLDVRDGKVTKGVRFLDNADVGDPVAMARYYYEQGADELVFYDITASNERRGIMIDVVRAVAREIFIPFSVGGGLRTLEDMRAVLLAGAEKVSIDSGAVRDPSLITAGARAFGSQCVVLSMQVKRTGRPGLPSGHEVIIDGGRTATGRDALEWAREGERLGAGELCINSIDADGTKAGYDLELIAAIRAVADVPVVASGGAGALGHFAPAVAAGADAVLAASVFHQRRFTIGEVKAALAAAGVVVR
jgi:cyclase